MGTKPLVDRQSGRGGCEHPSLDETRGEGVGGGCKAPCQLKRELRGLVVGAKTLVDRQSGRGGCKHPSLLKKSDGEVSVGTKHPSSVETKGERVGGGCKARRHSF